MRRDAICLCRWLREQTGPWGWLPGRGGTELDSKAGLGRTGRGRGAGDNALGWGRVTTWGQFLGQEFPSLRLYAYLYCPSLAALGEEEELLCPVIRLW